MQIKIANWLILQEKQLGYVKLGLKTTKGGFLIRDPPFCHL